MHYKIYSNWGWGSHASESPGVERHSCLTCPFKKKHSDKLSVRLSHPACEKELETLNRAEEERQRELTNAIMNTLQELQVSTDHIHICFHLISSRELAIRWL